MLTWLTAHYPRLVWFPRLPTAFFIVIVCVLHPLSVALPNVDQAHSARGQ